MKIRSGFRAVLVINFLTTLAWGCGSVPDYPPNLSFPSRSDRLVLKTPETSPPSLDEPGKMDAGIARVDSFGGETVLPITLSTDLRAAIDQFLIDVFGTPAAPKIQGEPTAERLGLNSTDLAEGSKLYRKHCLQCHNMSGDARGTAGQFVIPFPRDFRQGQFKFVTTEGYGKPRRSDILRTLAEGLKGTQMPAFGLLTETKRDLLARYVTYLSIRGQVEFECLVAVARGELNSIELVDSFGRGRLATILGQWEQAELSAVYPGAMTEPDDGEPGSPTHAEAVRRGHALFTAKTENSCISCHADYGRRPVLRFDIWGTVAKPADFHEPNLKGGTKPEQVFHRIRGGIPAVGMPAHPHLTDRQIWDLVRFIRAAPYPVQLPEDVRAVVYPNP